MEISTAHSFFCGAGDDYVHDADAMRDIQESIKARRHPFTNDDYG